jgi:serine/threonine protein kinase
MLRSKNAWIFLLLTALLVAGVGWWGDSQLHRVIRTNLRKDLKSALDANVTALEIWMANQKRIATSLADEPTLHLRALELLSLAYEQPTNRTALNERARQLNSTSGLNERLRDLGYEMAHLVDTNMLVVLETTRGRGGRTGRPVMEELKPKYQELFELGEPRIITPFKVPRPTNIRRPAGRNNDPRPPEIPGRTNQPPRRFLPLQRDPTAMQVATPIKNDGGETLGALVLIFNPNAEFTRILSVANYGDTGETFAFDGEGVLLSGSRFDHQLRQLGLIEDKPESVSALNLRLTDPGVNLTEGYTASTNGPLILMVERALAGESDVEIEPFRDYRGVPVVGAWRWLPQYGFGVGMKLDASDAFHLLRMVRAVFLVLFLLLLLAALALLLSSYVQLRVRRRLTEAELKARQLGQYRLIEKIGEGGMGSVYKARHALLRRETALKLLPPDKANDYTVKRFEQEVQLTCTLTHPNTIQVFDYGHTPDGIFYYAMEYLDGLNLADLATRYGPQPEERVIHIIRQVCDSLAEAHARGLIHRDIKPANVFLCDRGGVPDSVKVLDFGLVRHFGPNASTANLPEFAGKDGIVGTPNFIAPEAIQNPDSADTRSDIYSVGVVIYYLLTGQYIFDGESIADICRQHINDTPKTPSQRTGKQFDPSLEALVMQCLAKNPIDRPQTAVELSSQLSRCANATLWTKEQRTAWWILHRKSAAAESPAVKPVSSTRERTVKIDLDERTA